MGNKKLIKYIKISVLRVNISKITNQKPLSLSFFLVSCQDGGSSSKEIDYKTGINEISLEFLGDNTAYQERPLHLFMRLHNSLGYIIDNVKVSVVGLDEAYVELSKSEEMVGSMEGKSLFCDH